MISATLEAHKLYQTTYKLQLRTAPQYVRALSFGDKQEIHNDGLTFQS